MGQYKTIQGIRYEKDLIEYAESASARGRTLTKEDAEKLWEMAMDGNKVTPTERRTLEYILDKFQINASGKACLTAKLGGVVAPAVQRKGTGYYKTIDGISYDRALLEDAESRAQRNGGVVTFKDALELWAQAHDGPGVTEVERRTLKRIAVQYKLQLEARQVFQEYLGVSVLPSLADGSALPGRATGSTLPGRASLADGNVGVDLRLASAPDTIPGRAIDSERVQERSTRDDAVTGGATSSKLAITDDKPGFLASIWRRVTGQGTASSSTDAANSSQPLPQLADGRVTGQGTASSSADAGKSSQPLKQLADAKRQSVEASVAENDDATVLRLGKRQRTGTPDFASARLPPMAINDRPEDELRPELQRLLSEFSRGGDAPMLQIEYPQAQPDPEDAARAAQRECANAEVERIIGCKTAAEVLGGGGKADLKREFHRLAKLLHPDKGLVDADDKRADLAMRLVMAANLKVRKEA